MDRFPWLLLGRCKAQTLRREAENYGEVMLDLFAGAEPWQEPLAAGAVILRRFAFNAAEQQSAIAMTLPASRRFARWSPRGYTGGDDQLWASGLTS